MATDVEKQELLDTLKFTPCTYKISLSGYGGEIAMGTVDRKIYDYFQENEIDLEEWNSDWDNEADVPDDLKPFEPGSWYDCDNLAHETGVELSEVNYVSVENENGETVWEHTLDTDALGDLGIQFHDMEECYADNQPDGTVVVIGQSVEKGLFFEGEIPLTAAFDPAKLQFNYCDIDGWKLISSVIYNGEDIYSENYDTNGKSMEVSWQVIGEDGNE